MLESLLSKVAGSKVCFPMNFAKLLRTRFLQNSLLFYRWLLLIILDYIILYQTRTAHPLRRRINSALYEFS